MIKNCEYCRKEYETKKVNRKYCSLVCRNKGLRNTNGSNKICLVCGREFYVCKSLTSQKYCSVTCRNNSPIITVNFKCKKCKKIFETKTKQPYRLPSYCKNCLQVSAKQRHSKTKHYDHRRLILKKGKCEICGYDENIMILGVHHADRNRDDNSAGNLKVLCPNCHSLEHAKHIPHSMFRQTVQSL